MFSLFIYTIELPSQDLFSVEFQLHANYKIDYCPLFTGAVSLFYQRCKQIIRNIEDPISLKENPKSLWKWSISREVVTLRKGYERIDSPGRKAGVCYYNSDRRSDLFWRQSMKVIEMLINRTDLTEGMVLVQ